MKDIAYAACICTKIDETEDGCPVHDFSIGAPDLARTITGGVQWGDDVHGSHICALAHPHSGQHACSCGAKH
jgi:hypothetical protein